MALTRITKGVIKPNENYDTHNINSTGIVTAIGLDVNGNGDISGNLSVGGVLTYEDVTSIDSVGIITARDGIDCNGDLDVSGAVTTGDHVTLSGQNPRITFTDTNHNPDFEIYGSAGIFQVWDSTNAVGRLIVNSDGHIDIPGNLDCGADLDVDGHTNLDNVSIAGVTTVTDRLIFDNGTNAARDLEWQPANNRLAFFDLVKATFGNTVDLQISHNSSDSVISHISGGRGNLKILSGGAESIECVKAGSVKINHNGNLRFQTSSVGVSIPQDLDVDGHTNLDNVSIAGVTTTSDTIHIKADNKYLSIGAHNDGDMLSYHDGNKSVIVNYTGDFHIRSNNGSRSSQEGIILKPNGATEIYHSGNKKLETTSTGAVVTGKLSFTNTGNTIHLADSQKLYLGNGLDFEFFHDATENFIQTNNGNIRIRNSAENMARFVPNAAVELYYNNIKTFETSGYGIRVLGPEGGSGLLEISADEADDNNDKFRFAADPGAIYLQNYASGSWETNIKAISNGSVELYHDNNLRLTTTDDGITVDKGITVNGIEGGDAQIRLRADQGDDNNDMFRFVVSDGGTGLKIQGYDGSFQTRLTVATDGKIGIGTANPSNALDVQGGTTNTAIVARSTDSKAQISLVDNSTTSVGSVVVGAEGDALFLTSGSGGDERLRIGTNGSVGIGTDELSSNASFYNALTVVGDDTSQASVVKIKRVKSAASNGVYTLQVDSSAHTSNVSSAGAMAVDVNSGRAFTINGLGRVGINSATPQFDMEVMSPSGSTDTTLNVKGRGAGYSQLRLDGGASENYITSASDPLAIYVGSGGQKAKFDTSGNFLIGAGGADHYLHIKQAATTTYAKIETTHSSSTYTGINLKSPTLNFQIWNQGPGATGYSGSNSVVFWQAAATGPYAFYHGNDERLRIKSDGDVSITDGNLIVANGHGIDFSATGDGVSGVSELLDDYEEGSFTPTLKNFNGSYTSQIGRYTKVGNIVHYNVFVKINTAGDTGSPTGINMPFDNGSGMTVVGHLVGNESWDTNLSESNITTWMPNGSNEARFYKNSGSNLNGIRINDIGNSGEIAIAGSYRVS